MLVLAACGQGNTDSPTTSSLPTPVVGEVSLTRSGGFAGSTTTIIVAPDGVATVTDDSTGKREIVVPATELEALHRMVASPEFAELLDTYVPPEGVCCDFFFYDVSAEVGGRTIKSATADTLDTPAILQQVIDLLTGLTP